MIVYVDIDETICEYEDEREYPLAKPLPKNIDIINELHEAGHEVIYWTARGSQTGIDWAELTVEQLKKWGAKYTKLKLKKPHYDVFICDKAINSERFFEQYNEKDDEK